MVEIDKPAGLDKRTEASPLSQHPKSPSPRSPPRHHHRLENSLLVDAPSVRRVLNLRLRIAHRRRLHRRVCDLGLALLQFNSYRDSGLSIGGTLFLLAIGAALRRLLCRRGGAGALLLLGGGGAVSGRGGPIFS